MRDGAVKTGENRYWETFGRYHEDFEIDHICERRPGRTILEADNTWFTLLTMNQHPLRFDAEYAKPIANAAPTLAIVASMSVSDVSQKAIANLGWTDISMPAPCGMAMTISSMAPRPGLLTVSKAAASPCW